MAFTSKYQASTKPRKYVAGGYGVQDYGTNEEILATHYEKVKEEREIALQNYESATSATADKYKNNLAELGAQYQKQLTTQSAIKGAINAPLSRVKSGTTQSYRDIYNQNITDWFKGPEPVVASSGVEEGFSPEEATQMQEPGAVTGEQSEQVSGIGAPTWDPSQGYSRPFLGGTSKEAVKHATEMGAEAGTGFSTVAGETYTVTESGKVVKTATEFGAKETGTVVDASGKVVSGASKAPVKGGLWTTAVDVGLHYLSDDQDPSTYTAGEVATDVGSLALDVVTWDWIGAAMQLYDIGSQWAQRNKWKKRMKRAKEKWHRETDVAQAEYTEDWYESAKYTGNRRALQGKQSGYGRAKLGGFKYNI